MDLLPLSRIEQWRPCEEQLAIVRKRYPAGVPLTEEAVIDLERAGVDVTWGLVRLMRPRDRERYALEAMEYVRPHIATALAAAGLGEWAEKIASLRLDSAEAAKDAIPTLDRARLAANLAEKLAASWYVLAVRRILATLGSGNARHRTAWVAAREAAYIMFATSTPTLPDANAAWASAAEDLALLALRIVTTRHQQ